LTTGMRTVMMFFLLVKFCSTLPTAKDDVHLHLYLGNNVDNQNGMKMDMEAGYDYNNNTLYLGNNVDNQNGMEMDMEAGYDYNNNNNNNGGISGARASSEYLPHTGLWSPKKVIDNKISKNHVNIWHSNLEDYPWLELSIPEGYVTGVVITTRFDCCEHRFRDIEIRAGKNSVPSGYKGRLTVNTKVATFAGPANKGQQVRIDFDRSILAKYVTIQKIGKRTYLEINEVKILKGSGPTHNVQDCPEINMNYMIGKNVLITKNVLSWSDCSQLCRDRPECTAWTWHHENAGIYTHICKTMETISKKVADRLTISGGRTCMKSNSKFDSYGCLPGVKYNWNYKWCGPSMSRGDTRCGIKPYGNQEICKPLADEMMWAHPVQQRDILF